MLNYQIIIQLYFLFIGICIICRYALCICIYVQIYDWINQLSGSTYCLIKVLGIVLLVYISLLTQERELHNQLTACKQSYVELQRKLHGQLSTSEQKSVEFQKELQGRLSTCEQHSSQIQDQLNNYKQICANQSKLLAEASKEKEENFKMAQWLKNDLVSCEKNSVELHDTYVKNSSKVLDKLSDCKQTYANQSKLLDEANKEKEQLKRD